MRDITEADIRQGGNGSSNHTREVKRDRTIVAREVPTYARNIRLVWLDRKQ